jgi:hypothetical protein
MRRPDEATLAPLDEHEIERLAGEHDLALGFREAARRALAFARRYRDEEGAAGGARERACIVQALEWRRAVRDLHAGRPVPSLPDGIRPGLARARADEATGAADDGRKTG